MKITQLQKNIIKKKFGKTRHELLVVFRDELGTPGEVKIMLHNSKKYRLMADPQVTNHFIGMYSGGKRIDGRPAPDVVLEDIEALAEVGV